MKRVLISAVSAATLLACQPANETPTETVTVSQTPSETGLKPPSWTRSAVIYQINTRQYSEAGTFKAVEADLDRIQELGVDILWFMPIHPIGEVKRKGSLGSPYAVQDFQAINPEFGTLEDFKSLVDAAHARGMKVIIDLVANHTAWDHRLIYQHPEYYTRNADGEIQHPPDTDWYDVADLDYSQQGVRDYMTESMLYWVRDVGIDGYRADVAGMVPTDFWNEVRPQLDAVKPVFMLAEWQEPELHEQAFDASYAWRWKEILQDIVKGKANATDMAGYYADYQANWPAGAMRMAYSSNHDQNTWDGTPFEIYGEAYKAAIVLSFVGDGIPLIYNGQEACNDKRLEFFEKDLINWKEECELYDLFRQLVRLKTSYSPLHNGTAGARSVNIETSNPENILSFSRSHKDAKSVVAIFNLSDETQSYEITGPVPGGRYAEMFSADEVKLKRGFEESLGPWEYRIYVR